MPQTFSMTKVTFHLVSYELNMSQCLSPLKNSSCAVLGCKHILRAPSPPPNKKLCSVLNIYMSPFFVFSKEIDWPSLQGICYLIWEERSVACTLLQFLQPSLSECSRSSCRLCNDPATVCCCTDQFYPSYNGPSQRYSGHF